MWLYHTNFYRPLDCWQGIDPGLLNIWQNQSKNYTPGSPTFGLPDGGSSQL